MRLHDVAAGAAVVVVVVVHIRYIRVLYCCENYVRLLVQ